MDYAVDKALEPFIPCLWMALIFSFLITGAIFRKEGSQIFLLLRRKFFLQISFVILLFFFLFENLKLLQDPFTVVCPGCL